MKVLRASGAVGAAMVVTVLGAGAAFAWHPGDVTLTAGCRPNATHIRLEITDKFDQGGDFVLSRTGDSHLIKGHVDAKASTWLTAPYSGKGDRWKVTIKNVSASLNVTHADMCATPTPKPTPTPTSPSPTPSHSVPAATGGQLAHTGADGTIPALAAGGALMLGGAGLMLNSRRRGRRH